MTKTELLRKCGFTDLKENKFVKRPEDPEGISVLLETEDNRLMFTVPCASSTVDYEKEIEDYLKSNITDVRCVKASFHMRIMKIECVCSTGDEIVESVRASLELIGKVEKEFGMLPVCMACDRVIKSAAYIDMNGQLRTFCGICRDGIRLEASHERLTQKQFEKEKRYINKGKKKLYAEFLLAGLIAGLWSCAVGVLFMAISMLIPFLRFSMPIAAATAGFLLIRNLRKVNPKLTIRGILYANLSTALTIVIVSPLSTTLLVSILNMLSFGTADISNSSLDANGQAPFIILGLIVYLLTQLVCGFWLTEDVTDF